MRTAGEFKGGTIEAMDGDIGSVQDLCFDDQSWTVRYVVVDTGAWLPGRQVLISPFAFQAVPGASRLRTSLTKKQIEDSPSLDTDRPVNRQREVEFAQYYGYPYYWGGPYRWGALAYPELPINPQQPSPVELEMLAREREDGDPNLRSARDVMGYYISATDGDLGHVEDFLVDDETWAIRYIIVDTRNWLPGRRVLISPEWIQKVSWEDSKVYVDLSKRHIEAAPEFDPSTPLARAHEERLYDHLGRSKYWEREPGRKA
jgi:PRC-barrel domain